MRNIILILLSVLLFASCTTMQKHEIVGEAQGTYYRVVYYNQTELIHQSEVDSCLKSFDMSASNYAPESIISKVNRNEDVELNKVFTEIFNLAHRISEETNGMFDITVRPLVELYGFGKSAEVSITDIKRDSIMPFVGYQKVCIDSDKILKDDPRIQLDFNAIAQGYSVDYLMEFLISKGVKVCLVDIGGEVKSYGMKPDGKKWNVAVELPVEGAGYGEQRAAIIKLESEGMATSGNYRKFIEKDGKKYVHTINPLDGNTVQSNLLSATIVAPTAGEADAYATACMVMGLEKSIEFVERIPTIEAYFIYFNEKGEYAFYATDKMKKKITE